MRSLSSLAASVAVSSLVLAAAGAGVLTSPAGARPAVADAGHVDAAAIAAAAPGAIAWHACADPYLQKYSGQCGTLKVPLDPAKPAGTKISIAVSRVLHTTTPYRGVMFTNPGGPGGSGLYLGAYGHVYGTVGESYDWYGLDPRGVGESKPTLACNGKYFGFDRPAYRPSTKKILGYWLKKTEGYAKACGRSGAKELLPHMRTTDNIADYEALRTAIGVPKVSFFGYSYGTYIAQVYATLHPTSLKRIVMDGVIDPTRVFYRSNLDQDSAFEITIHKFFDWVGKRNKTYGLGKGGKAVYQTYLRLHRKLTTHPAAGGTVGPDEFDDALLTAGYYNLVWVDEANALSALNKGNAKPIQQEYRGSNPVGKGADNGYAVYLATQCTDAVWPSSWAKWKKDNTRLDKTAPFETWSNAWFNAPCRTWPVKGKKRVDVTGAGLKVPVLLLNETLDAATPYPGALKTRQLFPTSALLANPGGTTHAASGFSNSCEMGVISRYLSTGALPKRVQGNKADKTCAPLAPPARHVAGPAAKPVSRP